MSDNLSNALNEFDQTIDQTVEYSYEESTYQEGTYQEGTYQEDTYQEDTYQEDTYQEDSGNEKREDELVGATNDEDVVEAEPEMPIAEVVVIITSLGSIRKPFFESKRLLHLLNCKDIEYYIIDANRDTGVAQGKADIELLKQLSEGDFVLRNPNDEIMLPQVIIGGLNVGGLADLQNLEDDGDLDWIYYNSVCLMCLNERDSTMSACSNCGQQYCNIVPQELLDANKIIKICRGEVLQELNAEEKDLLGVNPYVLPDFQNDLSITNILSDELFNS